MLKRPHKWRLKCLQTLTRKKQAKKLESIQKRGFKHKEDIDKLVVEIKGRRTINSGTK